MKMFLRLVSAVAALSATPALAQNSVKPINDWLIVPGVRAGPITPATTHADLDRLFGVKNVVDQDVTVSDAGPESGTVLLADHAGESIVVLWTANKSRKTVDALFFCLPQQPIARVQKTCLWHSSERITFGTTLKQLEKLNGRAFQLQGFAWDYEGSISSWQGGPLSALNRACGGLVLRINPPDVAHLSTSERALFNGLSGDRAFSSSARGMQVLNPQVDWMSMSFDGCLGHSQ